MKEPNTHISNARDNAIKNQQCSIDHWQRGKDYTLFKDVIGKFGTEHQIVLFVEECVETLTAISKYRRKRAGSVAVVEELVDLTIMLAQMKMVYDPCDTEFDAIYKYKINRLRNIVKGI